MAISLLGPLNNVINQTTTEVINSEITKDVAGILKKLVDSSIIVIDDTLKKVQDLTKQEQS